MGVAICTNCVVRLVPHAVTGDVTLPLRRLDVTEEWLANVGTEVRVPDDDEGRPPAAAAVGCSFCGRSRDDLKKLFGTRHGPTSICDGCVRTARDIIAAEDGDLGSSS
jgi:hypothetical protein